MSITIVFRPIVPIIGYAMNYEYISKVLCINKDMPEKKCNGKCHLAKTINEAMDDTSSDKSSPKPSSSIEVIAMTNQVIDEFNFGNCVSINNNIAFTFIENKLVSGYPSNCFHPPIFIS